MWNPALGQWVCGDTGGRHWHDPEWGGYGRIGRPSYYGAAYEEAWSQYGGYGGYYGEPTLSSATRATNPSATRQLQTLLVGKGYSIAVDGDFGPNTAAAVRSYQVSVGLPATGVADQATWNSLKGAASSTASGGSTQAASEDGPSWSQVAGDLIGSFTTGVFGPSAEASPLAPQSAPASTLGITASTTEDKKFPWGWVLGGVGAVAVIGGGIYFATRKKK